ncbi:MAG TPA: hypothetical protein DCX12_12285 [Chloroflexi bacterium]|nr:hypothetical protein [Chloroflexota bacterium]HBV93845.1 hypothetical protein [Chloroflexota bacterium]
MAPPVGVGFAVAVPVDPAAVPRGVGFRDAVPEPPAAPAGERTIRSIRLPAATTANRRRRVVSSPIPTRPAWRRYGRRCGSAVGGG